MRSSGMTLRTVVLRVMFLALVIFGCAEQGVTQALKITTDTLATGIVGVAYSQTLSASGPSPKVWSIPPGSGPLPAGLSLGAVTGQITGFPATAGTSNFRIRVTRDDTFDEKDFSITINP